MTATLIEIIVIEFLENTTLSKGMLRSLSLFVGVLNILGTANGFRLAPCTSTTGADVSSSICQFTPTSVHCPSGYYCPLYESNQIQSYYPALVQAGCSSGVSVVKLTGNSSYNVLCPCTPGFYCPANTELPVFCPEGYYCPPSNTTITALGVPIPPTGLGAFGSLTYQCPKGTWCPAGQVVPFRCNHALSDCPAGSSEPNKTKNWILLGFIVGFIFLCFQLSEYIARRERRLQDMTLSEDAVDGGMPSPAAASPAPFEQSAITAPLLDGDAEAPYPDHGGATMFSTPQDSTMSFDIAFEDIGLTLPSGVAVMSNVHGRFRPKRLCAIMGPSGAGKTTVINLVTGKARRSTGRVKVNGHPTDGLSSIAKLVGFVPQDDVMLRELTVRDNISFSAEYRLPAGLSSLAVGHKVNQCISELGLDHVQHSVIGDERTRGVSGGQRKRVNIGIELVADPSILFLDEPTSGLDSTTSTSLCMTLKRIAESRSMTIAAVIHQPSLSSFLCFDDLLLLGKGGRVVYHGPVRDAPNYFASIGFPLPDQCNPADFYLDVAQGAVEPIGAPMAVKVGRGRDRFDFVELFDLWEEKRLLDAGLLGEGGPSPSWPESMKREDSVNSASHRSSNMVRQSSVSAMCRKDFESVETQLQSTKTATSIFVNLPTLVAGGLEEGVVAVGTYTSALWGDIVEAVHDAKGCLCRTVSSSSKTLSADSRGAAPSPVYVRHTASIWLQFVLCFSRALKQIFVGFRPFVSEMALHLVCGAVISTAANRLYFEGPLPTPVCAIQAYPLQTACASPQAAQYVQIGNFMSFGILFAAIASSSQTFGSEQVNYWRECSSGLLSVPYFFGRWIANFPRIFFSAVFFFFSFSIKFSNTGSALGLFQIILMLYWFGYSLGYVVSQLVPIKHAALLGVVLALVFAVGFAGANPNMNAVRDKPKSVQWIWALSGPRWALEAFYINRYSLSLTNHH